MIKSHGWIYRFYRKDINKEAEDAKINVNKGSISIVQDKKDLN
ncbi:hypothetical protein JTS93_12775 [Clostridium botulinum]|nr:hypothetical protein [Clostridium botulinum]